MIIRRIHREETPPFSLLLLADPSQEKVKEHLEKGVCFVAEEDKKIIGAYILEEKNEKSIELVNIAVKEHLHGKGIGKKLIQHVLQSTKEQGYEIIEVGTGNSSINQLAFYQKCGFRMTGIERNFFLENYKEPLFENGIRCQDMVRLTFFLQ
ncbi:GNAT family N-acetyltransferase [Priestia filamentosa]|uniref:Acetyltransferase n=1 Tax=Priestia filamentosa TaxID=1402861 RepID=A0A1X7E9J4_9BACI|nr:GNAT family N-acetyltransferase [Priestia filamentosa]AKO92622.1 acetyltransferase [Priestia filamentosa]MDT3762702.1 GNAT family N-acetyltransferase [Priestia filamentosa]OXS69237.1 GNAT family N-acetyltransferase [Priestia filamentosa]RJS64051.1 GNAT family N-acetyltransferase [Priestia filamentosa]WCM17767.1 GNAT family N-acetyltransferase [Priestia filamentosa]